jgi:hypothetical protein
MREFPPISKALIEHLNSLVPEKCPSLNMTEKEVWFYSGQRFLINLLNDVYKEQNESVLSSSIL